MVTGSLPNPVNEGQLTVNNHWWCIMGELTADRLQISINKVLAACGGKTYIDMVSAIS
jgi:hypothetical protein